MYKNSITLFLLIIFSLSVSAQTPLSVTASVDSVKCYNGSDGAVTLTISGGTPFQTSTRGLLISEFFADPTGTDSPFEFVELLVTKTINFSTTPYTVIFVNNGIATANGWINGGAITYAFSISSGTVNAGDVLYVGGSSMIPQTNIYRVLNTGTTNGDGSIGNSDVNGVLGNGGANADAIGVFDVAVGSITPSTVPVDAIFFGTAVGQAVVSGGSAGYQLPVNDRYNGGKLQSNSFLAPNVISGSYTKAVGSYNVQTNQFTSPRVWSNTTTFTDLSSSVSLEGLYNYSWNTGDTTKNLLGLVAGAYCYTVTDNTNSVNNCVDVGEPDEIAINLIFINATCLGDSNGGATLLLFGGNVPYTYNWSSGATTMNLSGVPAGNYDLTVTDANNCTAQSTAFVSEPDSISFVLLTQNVTCYGLDNGVASIQNVTGGNGGYSYLYGSTSGNIGLADGQGNAIDITPGTHYAVVQDINNCFSQQFFTITEPDSLTLSGSTTPASSQSANDGSIDITANGGTPNYTYEWSHGETTEDLVNTQGGHYCVTITDDNGCEIDDCFTINFVVGIYENLNNSINVFSTINEIVIIKTDESLSHFTGSVYSLSGQLMFNKSLKLKDHIAVINTNNWASGIYFVQINSDSGIFTRHVFVQ
jgi:hypothetical protein